MKRQLKIKLNHPTFSTFLFSSTPPPPSCAACVYVCVYGSVRLLSNEAGKKMVHVLSRDGRYEHNVERHGRESEGPL